MARIRTTQILLLSALLILAIPPLIFTVVGLWTGMSITEILSALASQYVADRVNLLVSSLAGLIPLLLLAAVIWIAWKIRKGQPDMTIYATGGVLPVLAVTIFVNLEYWPTFLPNRVYAGFPHGLEFVLGPGVFAPVGMLVGCGVAWFVRQNKA